MGSRREARTRPRRRASTEAGQGIVDEAVQGGAEVLDAFTLGFALRLPLPARLHVEAGIAAGTMAAGTLDDLHPLYTYHGALGWRWALLRVRLGYTAAFGAPSGDLERGTRGLFGHNVLLGVGVGL